MDNLLKWIPAIAIAVGTLQFWLTQRDKKLSLVSENALKFFYLPTEKSFQKCFNSSFTEQNKFEKTEAIQELLHEIEKLDGSLYLPSSVIINLEKIVIHKQSIKIKKANKLLISCSDNYWLTYEKYRSASGYQKLGFLTREHRNLFIRPLHRIRLFTSFIMFYIARIISITLLLILFELLLTKLSK